MNLPTFAQQKRVCVTVDDLPVVNYSTADHSFKVDVTTKLINTFDKYSIPAIGYVNERKLYTENILDDKKVALLRMWLEAGYELGNHTFSHHSYHRVGYETFIKDILEGEQVTKPLVTEYGQEYHYFRHPYLHIGSTEGSADSLRAFLSSRGYTEAPVTLDTDDYLFAKKYHIALDEGDTALASKIGRAYLLHTEKKINYYEKVSNGLFSRNIAHTLLLHSNLLNADYMDEIAQLFVKKGYDFISQGEVLKDRVYQSKITRYGPWGISWIDRWVLAFDKSNLLKNEPEVPKFITN